MPKISVVIPIYNVEKYLNRALDSVLNQTYKDFEVICVDDGSTDNSGKIADEYAKKDKRIKVIHQENQGLSMARNNGLKIANGEYIYFFDSDDVIHPELLETTTYYAEKFKADVVHFEFCKLKKSSEPEIVLFDKEHVKYMITENPLFLGIKKKGHRMSFNVWSKLYKRSILEGLEFVAGIHFEDYPHTFAVFAKHPKTVILDKELYFYTINQNSISNQNVKPKQIKDYHKGINFLYEIYKASHLKKELKYLKRHIISTVLKEELNKINKATGENKLLMLEAFACELKDLDAKGLISFWGNRLSRYLKYKQLIRSVK